MTDTTDSFLVPDWPAPDSIGAAVSLRSGGISKAPYLTNNMALHVGDNSVKVHKNRTNLGDRLKLKSIPVWLDQVHGNDVIYAPDIAVSCKADGSFSDKPDVVCAVLTADCLPILICNESGTEVAAIHAGWRSLSSGIVRNALTHFSAPCRTIMAFLGPAIGQNVYEVGAEVKAEFESNALSKSHQRQISDAFFPNHLNIKAGSYMADLYKLARAEFLACGVASVYGGNSCAFSDSERFYSYRRDPITGRNASLIWIK